MKVFIKPSAWSNSLAVSAAFGASWFVYLEPGVSDKARLALDRELYQAVQGVSTWPEINLYPSLGLDRVRSEGKEERGKRARSPEDVSARGPCATRVTEATN